MSSWQAPRAPTLGEWPAVQAAINRVFRPQGGDLARELPLFLNPGNLHNLRIIEDARARETGAPAVDSVDSIVAHAGYLPRRAVIQGRHVRVACVGAVFVRADQRGRGLGTRVVAALLAAARAASDLVLVSGNRGLYLRQGLQPAPPLLRFQIPHVESGGARIHTRDVMQGDIDSVMGMYADSDVCFIRSRNDWRQLIEAAVLMDAPARFSMILRAETPVAYVVAQCATALSDARAGEDESGGQERARPRRILECAGEPEAIVEAAPQLAEELLLPVHQTRMATCAARAGWVSSTRQLATSVQWVTAAGGDAPIPWYGLNYL